jgi:hypothetical protein
MLRQKFVILQAAAFLRQILSYIEWQSKERSTFKQSAIGRKEIHRNSPKGNSI